VTDSGNGTVRKISAQGIVSTIAGTAGVKGFFDGTGGNAKFEDPMGIAVHSTGNLYVSDARNHVVRKINPQGVVTTIAGGAPKEIATSDPQESRSVFSSSSFDGTSTVYHFRSDGRSGSRFSQAPLQTIDGYFSNLVDTYGADNKVNYQTPISSTNMVTDSLGNIFKVSSGPTVEKYARDGFAWSTFARITLQQTRPTPKLFTPPTPIPEPSLRSIAIDRADNLYVTDATTPVIYKITPDGVSSVFAGRLWNVDIGPVDGQGVEARFGYITNLVSDRVGNLFVWDLNFGIRKISPNGLVSTLAGSATAKGFTNGQGSAATFGNGLGAMAIDNHGNLYVADVSNFAVRKITPEGKVSTFVGREGSKGVSLSLLPASLGEITSLAINSGKLFIQTVESGNLALLWTYVP
jgi:hypothetical protein